MTTSLSSTNIEKPLLEHLCDEFMKKPFSTVHSDELPDPNIQNPEEIIVGMFEVKVKLLEQCLLNSENIEEIVEGYVIRSIKRHTMKCKIPGIKTWTKNWVSKKDRTEFSTRRFVHKISSKIIEDHPNLELPERHAIMAAEAFIREDWLMAAHEARLAAWASGGFSSANHELEKQLAAVEEII